MLTVLGYEGPQLRAYLLFLKAQGIAVERLVMLAPYKDITTGKPIAPFLPKQWRAKIGLKLSSLRMNHWPGIIALRHGELYRAVTGKMAEVYSLPAGFYETMLKKFNWQDYAGRVDILPMNGSLKDPDLYRWLAANIQGAVLYTGGGIVPEALLSIEGIRVIHVHPGYLPDVRGADGLLWSVLLRKKIGVSGFYMEKGIDTGALLFAHERDIITFEQPVGKVDGQLLYRALFAFVDPVIRAHALCGILKAGKDFAALPATAQDTNVGETFHFMHPALRDHVLATLFPK